jgi:hypothetical protein
VPAKLSASQRKQLFFPRALYLAFLQDAPHGYVVLSEPTSQLFLPKNVCGSLRSRRIILSPSYSGTSGFIAKCLQAYEPGGEGCVLRL